MSKILDLRRLGPRLVEAARRAALVVAMVPLASAFAQSQCAPLTLRASDLREILGQVLGDLRPLAEEYDASVVPSDKACYVHMTITTKRLPFLPSCELTACSIAVVSGQQIALREFDVAGCAFLFDTLKIRRDVPKAFTSAEKRIEAHCGSKGFKFQDAAPVSVGGEPAVVLRLLPGP